MELLSIVVFVLWVYIFAFRFCRFVDFVLQESNFIPQARFNSTRGYSQSAAGLEFLDLIRLGRLWVGHKPNLELPMNNPSLDGEKMKEN